MKQKIILKHPDSKILGHIGNLILNQWGYDIGENINFDPGNIGDLSDSEPRFPCLQLICSNDISGEIIMFCTRVTKIKMDLQELDS